MTRVFEILDAVKLHNKPDAICSKQFDEWQRLAANEFLQLIDDTATGLLRAGIQVGDRVAVVSNSRPEWNIVDFAIQLVGAVSVPMYPTLTVADYRFIMEDSGSNIVFAADEALTKKAQQAIEGLPNVSAIYSFDQLPNVAHWSALKATATQAEKQTIQQRKAAIKATDLFTLIYTSGTTGKPKGVMLSHQNVVSNLDASRDFFVVNASQKALSFLPLCHIFERSAVFAYLRAGTGVYYAESIDTVAADIREVKPHVFTTVPRMIEKVYDRIISKGHELSTIKKTLFFWAVKLGLNFDPAKPYKGFKKWQLGMARKLIFSKWLEALGGNVHYILCGSAALQPRLARVFTAAGIPILEGYGMTETSPGISMNSLGNIHVGTVGEVIPGIQVKFAEDGEILVKGPNVMMGYYNRPDATASTITTDGWLHTGDIGELIDAKYLKITDRKKEIFKTSGGKYIAPQLIENKLKTSTFIEQVCVVGDGEKFPAALIVPSFEAIETWAKQNQILFENNQEVTENQRVIKLIQSVVDEVNESLAQYEKIKKTKLLPNPWSIETGELTPTLKLKRKVILQKFEAEVSDMFGRA